MAGQPPEPSFQPTPQDQGLTQGRPAWQMSADYTPPGGSTAGPGTGGQTYATPPPPVYASQEQGYPAQDQTYTMGGQAYQQQYQQAYQGQGVPPPQWSQPPGQSAPGQSAAPGQVRAPKQKGEKGLIGSLLDFSFSSMVTPKIIKALYVLFTIWTIIAALIILVFFDKTGGIEAALFAFFIIDPIFILLSLGIYRIVLEAFMVIFQIHGELKTIRTQGEEQS
jgi:Domain of unknown function (DUF4282)